MRLSCSFGCKLVFGSALGALGAWPASQAHVPSPTQCVDMQPGAKSSDLTESWGNIFGCCDDPVGCCYVCTNVCHSCALSDIGKTMGHFKVGPKKEKASRFMSSRGQADNKLSYCPCCCILACCGCCDISGPEKYLCCYDGHILEAYATYANKETKSPIPCSPMISMCCCSPCIYCLIYRELKLSPCKEVVYGAPPPSSHEISRV